MPRLDATARGALDWGIVAAALSSVIGGTAIGATRYLAGALSPVAIGACRFGIGCALLLPLCRWQRAPWPPRRDAACAMALGLLLFTAFPLLFNTALRATTASRGALDLSTMPLLTMVIGALLGVEAFDRRRCIGVCVAIAGVAVSLLSGLAAAPRGAWRGDLTMLLAACGMAAYNVLAKPLFARSSALSVTCVAMSTGAAGLLLLALAGGALRPLRELDAAGALALLYLGVFGGAAAFYLWSLGLQRSSPTQVATTVTLNPVSAAWVGHALLGEALPWSTWVGVAAIFAGIVLASTSASARAA